MYYLILSIINNIPAPPSQNYQVAPPVLFPYLGFESQLRDSEKLRKTAAEPQPGVSPVTNCWYRLHITNILEHIYDWPFPSLSLASLTFSVRAFTSRESPCLYDRTLPSFLLAISLITRYIVDQSWNPCIYPSFRIFYILSLLFTALWEGKNVFLAYTAFYVGIRPRIDWKNKT